MEIIELWPFSQGELERSPDAFADAAFARGRLRALPIDALWNSEP